MKLFFWNHLRDAVASIAAATALILVSGCGSSNAQTVAPPARVTSVVLVHGAWADGSSWTKVVALLQQRGLKVISVQLPRASLTGDAATVRRTIDTQPGQVVLVGHSYGGVVISEAGTNAKVAALVYVSAFAPSDGESISDLVKPYPTGEWQKGLSADSAGYLSLSTEAVQTYFAQDLSKTEAAVLAATQAPVFNHVLEDRVTVAAWKTKPSWWVISGDDKIVPAAFQQGQASRIKAKVTLIGGASHVALISRPAEVSSVILDAVRSVGGL